MQRKRGSRAWEGKGGGRDEHSRVRFHWGKWGGVLSLTASGSYDDCDFLFLLNVSVDAYMRRWWSEEGVSR